MQMLARAAASRFYFVRKNLRKKKIRICDTDTENYRGGRVLELGFGLGIAASEVIMSNSFKTRRDLLLDCASVKDHWKTIFSH